MIFDLTSFTVNQCINRDFATQSKVLHIPVDISADETPSITASYIVRVKTGSQSLMPPKERNAMAPVSIILLDAINDSIRIDLQRSPNSLRAAFQPGQEDRFELTIASMLEVNMCT
jgi:hypothetical protein